MAEAPAPDCLTTLLGLAEAAIPCYPFPTGADTDAIMASATGLHLADAEGLKFGPVAGATAATDLYDRLKSARKLAAFQLRAALEAGRAKSFGAPLFQQRGTLGGPGNGQLAPAGARAYLSFYTNSRPAGAWRITRLSLFTSVPVTDAPLFIDGEEVCTITTNAAGLAAGLPAGGLLLPLDGGQHTLEVLLPDGVRVKQNNFFAGCFSCQRGTPWAQSVQANLQDVSATTPGNGFGLSLNEECAADSDLLCYAIGSEEEGGATRYPELARYLGIALLYKAAELFTDGLLAGASTNRYTMLEPKALAALSDKYAQQYATYLAWLNSPGGLGQVQHPCYEPPRGNGPFIVRTT